MKKQYFALKSSLPMLRFDELPPITSARFLEMCEAFVAPKLLHFLEALTLAPKEIPQVEKNFKEAAIPTGSSWKSDFIAMEKYVQWEITLRNTLAALRAGKQAKDPAQFQIRDTALDSTAVAAAQNIFGMTADPLEKERALDLARWNFLDGMEWNHAFNFEALCIYRCKLMILEKWAARKKGDPVKNLDSAAEKSENALKDQNNNYNIQNQE